MRIPRAEGTSSATLTATLALLLLVGPLWASSVAGAPRSLANMPVCGDPGEEPVRAPCDEWRRMDEVQLFHVPGKGTRHVPFDFVREYALYENELIMVPVDDANGHIGELEPGENGYARAAVDRARVVFEQDADPRSPDVNVPLTGGEYVLFGLVSNATLVELRAKNPTNAAGQEPIAFFSMDALNPDGVDHFVGYEHKSRPAIQFAFEDLFGGGDLSYDDLAYTVRAGLEGEGGAGCRSGIRYSNGYDARREHNESLSEECRSEELRGLLDTEYLTGSPTPYVQGTHAGEPLSTSWDDGVLTVRNVHDQPVRLAEGHVRHGPADHAVEVGLPTNATSDGEPVDLSALAADPEGRDGPDDGLVEATVSTDVGGVTAERELRVLEGLVQSEVRTTLTDEAGAALAMTSSALLPTDDGSWVAYPQGDQVHAVPIEELGNRSIPLEDRVNTWVAVYHQGTSTVTGVVVSGTPRAVDLAGVDDGVEVRAQHTGAGSITSAIYPVRYELVHERATRWLGIQEIARQDAEEVGAVYIADDRFAATGTAASKAQIDGERPDGLASLWSELNGIRGEWTIEVDAPSRNGGKHLRLVLPADHAERGTLKFRVDGVQVTPDQVISDGNTVVVLLPIDHFSLRRIQLQSIAPGVSPLWMWATIGLGTVVAGLSVSMLQSSAAKRGASGAKAEPKSEAVKRALGEEDEGSSEARSKAVRRALDEDTKDSDAETDDDGGMKFRSNVMRSEHANRTDE